LAFASRIKEFAAITANTVSSSSGDIASDLDGIFDGSRKLFSDDLAQIRSVVQAGIGGTSTKHEKPVGIAKLQASLDVLTERLDYVVHNDIPLPVPLSEILRNSVARRIDFFESDYDKAVVDKILMVLSSSEGLAKKTLGVPTTEEVTEEDTDADLQKEQVAEEEVLQEQEEEEEEEEGTFVFFLHIPLVIISLCTT
jgi:hypothetical protein